MPVTIWSTPLCRHHQTDPAEDDATTSVSQDADLTIEKDVDIDEISAPGVLTYTITVENTGTEA